MAKVLAGVQAAYFLVTGVWPLVHLASFEAVTGGKADDWLVRGFGGLVVAVGLVLARGARGAGPSRDVAWLGLLSAVALATIDVVSVATAGLSPVYLADAAAEAALAAGWVLVLRRRAPEMARA